MIFSHDAFFMYESGGLYTNNGKSSLAVVLDIFCEKFGILIELDYFHNSPLLAVTHLESYWH